MDKKWIVAKYIRCLIKKGYKYIGNGKFQCGDHIIEVK